MMTYPRPQRAFTLIELLVVMTIIALLIALVVGVGMPTLRQRAKDAVTNSRIQAIQNGLQIHRSEHSLSSLFEAVEIYLQFAPLREVILKQQAEHGRTLRQMTRSSDNPPRASDGFLPPNLGNRFENDDYLDPAVAGPRYWPNRQATIDSVITFLDRQALNGSYNAVTETQLTPLPANRFHMPRTSAQAGGDVNWFGRMAIRDESGSLHLVYHYGDWSYDVLLGSSTSTKLQRIRNLIEHDGKTKYRWYLTRFRDGNVSSQGETLGGTLEALPDGSWTTADFFSAWPNLIETPVAVGDERVHQVAWPFLTRSESWDQDTPSATVPIWNWPWGRPVISRGQGGLLPEQIEYHWDSAESEFVTRKLTDLNPLHTIALLQRSGALPTVAEGATYYRDNRDPGRSWNDAYGNPLVVGVAAVIPPRYDYDDVNDLRSYDWFDENLHPKETADMFGGRDFLYRTAERTYGSARSLYFAIGAPGPTLMDDLPSPWEAADDHAVLRSLWQQILLDTDAHEWDGAAMSDPPWSNITTGGSGRRSYLSSPIELK